MPSRLEMAHTFAAAIHASNPALQIVATPRAGLWQSPILAPDLYPDTKPERGYYVPVPAPPPFKVSDRQLPALVGTSGGRQWTIRFLLGGTPSYEVVPNLSVSTFVRMVPQDTPPIPYLPWAVATGQPEYAPSRALGGPGPINLAGRAARRAVGSAALLSGRPLVSLVRPPLRSPMILESNDPAFRGLLDSPNFLALYQGWDQRSGAAGGRGGSAFPVVRFLAERFHFETGIDLERPPGVHAETVRELLELVPELERAVTGRDPEVEPIPSVTFTDPPGSVPDLRAGFRCPKCGRLEILKMEMDPSTGLTHKRTLGCGVDVFPPFPDRIRDVEAVGAGTVRPPG